MSIPSRSNSKFNIGFDIGAYSLKVAELDFHKSTYILKNIKEHYYDSYVTEDGAIVNYGELTKGISTVLDSIGLEDCNVAIALKGPSIVVRKLSVYCEKPEEIEEMFPWIMDQYVAIDPEETAFDYRRMPIPYQNKFNHVPILFTSANRESVVDFVSVLESSNLIPNVLEAEALSLVRLYRGLDLAKDGISLILHIGNVGSSAIFLKDSIFDYHKDISIGSLHCSKLLKQINVDDDDIEKVKIDPSIHTSPEEVKHILINEFAVDLISELDEVLMYYSIFGGGNPANIYISGGACEIYGLKDSIADKYQASVDFLDPWKTIQIPDDLVNTVNSLDNKYTYNIAIGLALHGKIY